MYGEGRIDAETLVPVTGVVVSIGVSLGIYRRWNDALEYKPWLMLQLHGSAWETLEYSWNQ